jgi:hypothetical protein
VGVVGCDVLEGGGELEAVAEDEVEAVVGVAAGDLLGLGDGDVFGVGGEEAGVALEAGDALVGELAPAAVVDDAGEEEDDLGWAGLSAEGGGEGGEGGGLEEGAASDRHRPWCPPVVWWVLL